MITYVIYVEHTGDKSSKLMTVILKQTYHQTNKIQTTVQSFW